MFLSVLLKLACTSFSLMACKSEMGDFDFSLPINSNDDGLFTSTDTRTQNGTSNLYRLFAAPKICSCRTIP